MKFTESLKKNSDFQLVFKNGKSKANRNFIMYILKNGSDKNFLGISVSKKVGNSVIRHRIKRLLKENLITFMGTDIHHNKSDYDFVEKAKKKFKKYITDDEINNIFENNAKRILNK